MSRVLAIAVLITGSVAVAIGLPLLAIWARRRGKEYRERHPHARQTDWVRALEKRRFAEAREAYFFGPLPPSLERLGKALALAVILVLVGVALLVLYLLASRTQ